MVITLLILGLVAGLLLFLAPEATVVAALSIGVFVEPLIFEARAFIAWAIAEWPWQPIATAGAYIIGFLNILFEIRDVLRELWRHRARKKAHKRNRKQKKAASEG